MKVILKSIVVSSFFIASQLTFAGSFVDSATVTSVEKVYKQYRVDEPYQDCYIKETIQNGDGSATNEIMGAILGGAIGNQFGEGDGKDAMTLAGILLGASLAHDDEIANNQTGGYTTRTKCYIERRYDESTRKVYSHSTLTFNIKGKKYRVDFTK